MRARPFDWSPETVKRFWDYVSQREDLEPTYFTSQVGFGVATFLSEAVALQAAKILDYGCGRGHLARHLLDRGALVSAADFSSDSVDSVNEAFHSLSGWREAKVIEGTTIPWPDASFDIVTCLETIEHVLPEHLDEMFLEIFRVLRPGGTSLFTTPNSENLDHAKVCCPSCLTEFHRWQHVRSWTAPSLRVALSEYGFEPDFVEPLDFKVFQPRKPMSWRDWSPRSAVAAARRVRARILDTVFPRPFPAGRQFRWTISHGRKIHLVALARKP